MLSLNLIGCAVKTSDCCKPCGKPVGALSTSADSSWDNNLLLKWHAWELESRRCVERVGLVGVFM